VIVNKNDKQVICTHITNGKTHDLKLFRYSKIHLHERMQGITDTGYIGITKLLKNIRLPIRRKNKKDHRLTREEKAYNRNISRIRVPNEHVIGFIKRFKIVSDRYRNRRKRFGLRFNLICGICNFDRR